MTMNDERPKPQAQVHLRLASLRLKSIFILARPVDDDWPFKDTGAVC